MHAIIVTGGKQYKVAEGEAVFIEKLPAEAGDQVVFDQVLAILDGDNAAIGTPVVSGVGDTVAPDFCIGHFNFHCDTLFSFMGHRPAPAQSHRKYHSSVFRKS